LIHYAEKPDKAMTEEKREVLLKLHRVTAGLIFLTGVAIHLVALIIGRENFLRYVFTPLFDRLFAIPMAFAGISGIILWKNVRLNRRWKKAAYRVGMFYLLASIPLHIQTLVTQDTSYINKFPVAYSYFIMPVMLFFSVLFFTQVKYKRQDQTI
jgi:cytochrome bd-type quinol oxidase subunit 2